MDRTSLAFGTGAVLLLAAMIGFTQGRSDPRVDRLALRVDSLAGTLTDVVATLERANPPPPPDTIAIQASGLARGAPDAPVTMVEFLDYECPFCRRFHTETMPTLLEEYVATGQLRVVVRDRPLPMHENAVPAARAARCAAEQGDDAYWRFSDALVAAGAPLDRERVLEVATGAGIDTDLLAACLDSDRHVAAIEADAAAAADAGVTGTPTFVIGPSADDGHIRGRAIRGAYPIETFRSAIDGALAAASDS
ncbi:MAG: thioredoxin domain-containing protein [Myxococcota bacterium]